MATTSGYLSPGVLRTILLLLSLSLLVSYSSDRVASRKCNWTIIREKQGMPFDTIGASDFYDLVVEDGAFVDKSMLIDEFLLQPKKVIVLSCPPRFGKTLNVDMLRRFFQIETDERGVLLPDEKRINAALFFGGRIIYTADGTYRDLKPLRIVEQAYSVAQQGSYPVVRLSLGGGTRADNYAQFLDEFRARIGRLYSEYGYVKANLTTDDDKALFDRFSSGCETSERNDDKKDGRLEECLLFLSVKLERYFGAKVFIFLDDYDAPFTNLMSSTASLSTLNEVAGDERTITDVAKTAKFLRRVLRNVLRSNPSYHRAMLTGLFPTDATNLIDESESVREFTVRKAGSFCEYYGFSESDVNDLMNGCWLWGADDGAQYWYGGYRFDDSAVGWKMYNPYSIMRTFQANGVRDSYWTPSMRAATEGTDNENVVRYVETIVRENGRRTGFRKLLAGQSVREKIEANEKGNFADFLSNPYRCLLHAGYLTWLPPKEESSSDREDTVELKIPNYEVELALANMSTSSSR